MALATEILTLDRAKRELEIPDIIRDHDVLIQAISVAP